MDALIAFSRSGAHPDLVRQSLVAIQQTGLAEASDHLAARLSASKDPLERRTILAAFALYPTPASEAALARLAPRDPEEAKLLAAARTPPRAAGVNGTGGAR